MVTFNNILILCVGNVCRSPMAECLLKSALSSKLLLEKNSNVMFNIRSAGLHALVGHGIDSTAHDVLQQNGYSYGNHRARQVQERELINADVVLVMEQRQLDEVVEQLPQIRGKVFLLGKWQDNRDIPDPFKQDKSVFEYTFQLIDEAVHAWAARLVI